jgi:hypothetical protein
MVYIHLGKCKPERGSCEYGNESWSSVKDAEFLEWLDNSQFLKKDCSIYLLNQPVIISYFQYSDCLVNHQTLMFIYT